MRDIEKAYKKSNIKDRIDFMSFRGHVVTLAEPEKYKKSWGAPWRIQELPMIPDEFKLENIKGTTQVSKAIKDKLKTENYDYIINACDAAREGELIFYNFYENLPKKYQLPVKRLWAQDTTEETLKHALKDLVDGKDKDLLNLKEAAKLRARWDWMFGLNMTRLFTLMERDLVVVGRVMTSTLFLVELREREIENFTPIDFFDLEGTFKKGKDAFSGKLLLEDEKVRTADKKYFEAIRATLNKEKIGKVEKTESAKKTEYAKPCYNLTDLQKDAAKLYKFSPAKTLQIAQSLYETKKILSYPRTESRFISTPAAKIIEPFVKEALRVPEFKGIKIEEDKIKNFSKNKRYVDDKKITDHHALLPTKEFKAEKLRYLTADEKKIFMLVLTRLLSIFMKDYVEEKTNVYIKVKDQTFRATGTVLVEEGFYKILGTNKVDTPLPLLKKGDEVNIDSLKVNSYKTKPPVNYTEGTLLSAMESAGKGVEEEDYRKILKETGGLGTAATRAEIIEKLKRNGYIELRKSYIHPTRKGRNIIGFLEPFNLCNPEITAEWEIKLRNIEDGSLKPEKEMKEFKEYIKTMTDNVLNSRDSYKEGALIGKCPKCGNRVMTGRYGYQCENYKNRDGGPVCDFFIGFEICGADITPEDVSKMLEGEKTEPKFMTFKSGKTGTPTLSINKEGELEFNFENREVATCPFCHKPIRETKKYYMCDGYLEEDETKKCNFIFKKDFYGQKFEDKDIIELVKFGETKPKTFKWKSGKISDARLVLNKEEKKIDLDFNF